MPDLIRQAIGQPQAKVRTVHRLDQVVGGLMVYGLTGHAASELSRQIREDQFQKRIPGGGPLASPVRCGNLY